MLPKFLRYWRTLRYLRFAQIWGQVRVRIEKRFRSPSKIRGPIWEPKATGGLLKLAAPVPPQKVDDLTIGRFCFVGNSCDLGESPDWLAKGQGRLWQYNLHYFDWLWSLLAEGEGHWEVARRLTLDWIERHPPAPKACGWEPYPTSLRLINWSLLFGIQIRHILVSDSFFKNRFLESLSVQCLWLEKNLETHIQANHLLENIAALVCVASVFEGPDRERLLGRMFPLLKHELKEQVLADGMHYERSPMYHLRILWLMEMLHSVGDEDVRELVSEPRRMMQKALTHLRHPDGGIAQFNDAALGIYQDSWQSNNEAGAWSLPQAGYYGYRSSTGDYLIADVGPIGPNHQPGHAHADFFSFELSLSGNRVVTDTGIATYEAGSRRSVDRSTAAHSTIEIAGENSVEVWGGFRVGRRSSPRVLHWEERPAGCHLRAEHDGYRWLPGRPVHQREWSWRDGVLEIKDQILCQKPIDVAGRIHLAPGVTADLEDNRLRCRAGDLTFFVSCEGSGSIGVEESEASPSFGQMCKRIVLVKRSQAIPPKLNWVWRIEWD